jgi:predicted AAA+ superfamily ATPase
MRTSGKYYSIDTGIRNAQNGFNPTNQGMLLENIVYIELLRRGYDVYTLKLRSGKEIDFVAIKGNETQYVQVTQTLKTEKTIKREKSGLEQIALIDSLLSIKDNYRKILISELDRTQTSPDGIEIINLID